MTSAKSVTGGFALLGTKTFSGTTATGSGTVTASFTGGGAACGYTVSQLLPITAVGTPAPNGPTFPHGLFSFTTSSCTVGSTLDFTITYPQALPIGTQYWKFGRTAADHNAHWYALPATISGNTARFSLTDGGLGDDDLTADGSITDPGGVAMSTASPIPTLSQWSLMLLAGLLAWLTRRQLLLSGRLVAWRKRY